MITILFLGTELTEISETQQGREAREIEDTLRLSQFRDQFKFFQRLSVRPEDLSQLLLDINPTVLHFSASSTATGAICIRDAQEHLVPISPEALADLVALFSDRLRCVVLSRCFSEDQATVLVKHIPYVVGLRRESSGKAVLAFSKGFYQALAAQRPIEQASLFGNIQIRLNGISDCPNPVLVRKPPSQAILPLEGRYLSRVPVTELHSNEWLYTGYSTEFIRSLAIDPQNSAVLYVGTSQGTGVQGVRSIYLSEDHGVTWNPVDGAIPESTEVTVVRVSPLSGRVYIGTDHGLFLSDDRGAHWTADKKLATKEVRTLALSPMTGRPFLCGTGEYFCGAVASAGVGVIGEHSGSVNLQADSDDISDGDLHVSLDGGLTYKTVRGLKNVNDISVAPQDTSFICLATSDLGVFRSTDGGLSYESVGRLGAEHVFSIAISPHTLYDVFAGTNSGLFVSHDAGDSWKRIEQIPKTQVLAIVFSKLDSRHIFVGTHVGIYESNDGGSSWKAINRGLDHLWTMAIATTEQGNIYAGTSGGGIFKKAEGKLNWEAIGLGFCAIWPFLSVETCTDDLLYGANSNGVCRSLNGGLTWRQVGYFHSEHGRIDGVFALVVVRESPFTEDTRRGDVFLSSDGGATWQNPDDLRVKAICAGTLEGRIYTSLDNAHTWQMAVEVGERICALIAHPKREGLLFAASLGRGVFRSTDFGKSWQPSNQGLEEDLIITEIAAISSPSALLLYAGSGKGRLYRSGNPGQNWQFVSDDFGGSPIFGVASDETSDIIYVATEGSGAFKTQDNGKTWQQVNTGLESLKTYTIVVSSEDRNTIYLGTSEGVYHSKDGANSWALLGGKDSAPAIVNRLVFSPSSKLLYAAASNGLFAILVEQ